MLNSTKRVKIIQRRYGRKALGPEAVYMKVTQSISRKKAISVIRLGDVMAKLLARRNIRSLYYVSEFLGVKLPPSRRLNNQLDQAVKTSDVVGLSHYKKSIRLIKRYMKRTGWVPPFIADSFINDQLYEKGLLQLLIRRYRVALVGRASAAAAKQLRLQGLRIPLTVNLDNADQIPVVMKILKKYRGRYDLVLVGASVPGRILCSKIKSELNITAVEIGHMMDALSSPKDWGKPNNRMRFKNRFLRQAKNKK
ncbi:MAG: hypothetical protein K0S39_4551 [Paenibacillus sp.]|jgi:hypothetical protein|nr:hypothetical protein [Paenibacillus sp.]